MKTLFSVLSFIITLLRFLFFVLFAAVVISLGASLLFSFKEGVDSPSGTPFEVQSTFSPEEQKGEVLISLFLQNRGLFHQKWVTQVKVLADSREIATDKKELEIAPRQATKVDLKLQLSQEDMGFLGSAPDSLDKLKLQFGLSLETKPKLGQIGLEAEFQKGAEQ